MHSRRAFAKINDERQDNFTVVDEAAIIWIKLWESGRGEKNIVRFIRKNFKYSINLENVAREKNRPTKWK